MKFYDLIIIRSRRSTTLNISRKSVCNWRHLTGAMDDIKLKADISMRHLAIFSFLIFPSLIESYMWDSVCWPVMILSTLPSRKWRHFCNAFTIAHAYFSTECHLCSKCDRVLEEKATYRSPGLIERCCQRVFWSIHLRNWVFYKKFQCIEWIYLISPKLKFCTSKYCMIDLRIFFQSIANTMKTRL